RRVGVGNSGVPGKAGEEGKVFISGVDEYPLSETEKGTFFPRIASPGGGGDTVITDSRDESGRRGPLEGGTLGEVDSSSPSGAGIKGRGKARGGIDTRPGNPADG
ncbi:unnamed protein product, partial [Discosporangium mesarthrocarpum]